MFRDSVSFCLCGFEYRLLDSEINEAYFDFHANPSVISSCVSQSTEKVATAYLDQIRLDDAFNAVGT
jgi:hypothetical protein